ncbi:hypothetical protein BN1263440003 [Stenotrophomonas indicatrix]|nr:hypothetical protein BN1263440003 [Stenotrophomonas indicatrix]
MGAHAKSRNRSRDSCLSLLGSDLQHSIPGKKKPRLGRGLRLDSGKTAAYFDDLGSHRYAVIVSALLNCRAARASAVRKLASIHS